MVFHGAIVPRNGQIAHGMRKALQGLKRKFPEENENITKLYVHI